MHCFYEEQHRILLDLHVTNQHVLVKLKIATAEPRDRIKALLKLRDRHTPHIANISLVERHSELSAQREDAELTALPKKVEELHDLREAHLLEVALKNRTKRIKTVVGQNHLGK